jgi:phage tail-like protein
VPDRVVLAPAFNFQVRLFLAQPAAEGQMRGPNFVPSGDTLLTADGAFQECSGLDVEMDVQEYLEGGRNDSVIKRIGRAKYQPLVLKRGMFYTVQTPSDPPATGPVSRNGEMVDPALWRWFQHVVSGHRPAARYDGIIEVLDRTFDPMDAAPVAKWFFDRGLPAKVVGPQLNAKTGEVAIEELHIAHEGLRLWFPEPPTEPPSQ